MAQLRLVGLNTTTGKAASIQPGDSLENFAISGGVVYKGFITLVGDFPAAPARSNGDLWVVNSAGALVDPVPPGQTVNPGDWIVWTTAPAAQWQYMAPVMEGEVLAGLAASATAKDMGGGSVTNVNLVDGVDVSTHGARHISTGGDPVPAVVAAGASGLMTGADKTRLDGMENGAQVVTEARVLAGLSNSGTAKNMGGASITNVNQVDGVDVSAHAARHVTGGGDVIADVIAAGASGLMSGADKTKLDGLGAAGRPKVRMEWYADFQNGVDLTGTGAESAPYKTLTKAVEAAHAADVLAGSNYFHVIHLAPGRYITGAADSTITFIGSSDGLVPWVGLPIFCLIKSDETNVRMAATLRNSVELGYVAVVKDGSWVEFSGVTIRPGDATTHPTWPSLCVGMGTVLLDNVKITDEDYTAAFATAQAIQVSFGAQDGVITTPGGENGAISGMFDSYVEATNEAAIDYTKSDKPFYAERTSIYGSTTAGADRAAIQGVMPGIGLKDCFVECVRQGVQVGQAIHVTGIVAGGTVPNEKYAILLEDTRLVSNRNAANEYNTYLVSGAADVRVRVNHCTFVDGTTGVDTTNPILAIQTGATPIMDWGHNTDVLGNEVIHAIPASQGLHYSTRVANRNRIDIPNLPAIFGPLPFPSVLQRIPVYGNNGLPLPMTIVDMTTNQVIPQESLAGVTGISVLWDPAARAYIDIGNLTAAPILLFQIIMPGAILGAMNPVPGP